MVYKIATFFPVCGATPQFGPRPPVLMFVQHTHTHIRWVSPDRVISSSQRQPPEQQTQEKNTFAFSGIRTRVAAIKQLQTYALDRTATVIGRY